MRSRMAALLSVVTLIVTAACSSPPPAAEPEELFLAYPNACTAIVTANGSLAPVVRTAPRPVGGEVEEVDGFDLPGPIGVLGTTGGHKVVRQRDDGPVGYLPNENIECFGRPAPADWPGFPFEEERLPMRCEVNQAPVLPSLYNRPWPESLVVEPLDPGQPIVVLGASEPAPTELTHSYGNGHLVPASTAGSTAYVRWHDVACA